MGHYLAARYYRVDATLPFFIPFPIPGMSLVGTLGAFIRIRGPIPHRRALFDIGVAGPLAGFLVCLPVLWLGDPRGHRAAPASRRRGNVLRRASRLPVGGPPRPRPDPRRPTLVMGQLGPRRLVRPLRDRPQPHADRPARRRPRRLRPPARKARLISRVGSWVCVALIYFGPSWILWAVLVRVLGRRHPPTLDDEAPVGRGRVWVGLLCLAVFVVCFVPNPIVFSLARLLRGDGAREAAEVTGGARPSAPRHPEEPPPRRATRDPQSRHRRIPRDRVHRSPCSG